MNILVKSFSNIHLDGISAGDAFSVYSNYPDLSVALLAALIEYDEGREPIKSEIGNSDNSEVLNP